MSSPQKIDDNVTDSGMESAAMARKARKEMFTQGKRHVGEMIDSARALEKSAQAVIDSPEIYPPGIVTAAKRIKLTLVAESTTLARLQAVAWDGSWW